MFDEIHKFRGWRNWLKGQFDLHGENRKNLVTGSARLDVYHQGGDSMQGRFFLHHLRPLTLSEVMGVSNELKELDAIKDAPLPVSSRWRRAYGTTLVREDQCAA